MPERCGKRIIYVCDDLMLGGWTSVTAMLIELKKRGEIVSAITLFGKGYNAEILEKNGIKVECLMLNKLNFPWKFLKLILTFLRDKPDIVHSHLHYSDCFGMTCAYLAGVRKRIAHIHSIREKYRHPLALLRHFAYKNASLLVAVSDAAAANFTRENPRFSGRIEVLHNGINLEDFRERNSKSRITKDTLGIREDEFCVLTVANFKWQKAYPNLIAAAEMLKNEKIRFVIAGYGPDKDSIMELVKVNALEENVIFLGQRTDVPELMKAADCFLLPSVVEPFGICLVEAFAAGLPVIATSVDGIVEIAENMQNAILLEPSNPQAIRDAILKLRSDNKLRIMLSSNATLSSRKFDIKKTTDRMQKLYNTVD